MEHTPGKWKVKEYGGLTFIKPVNYTKNMEERNGFGICEMLGPDHKANALLIAAAPELLEVCEAVMLWAKTGNHGGNPYCNNFVKLAEEAIKKAGGE